jgi:predicted dehydrogenase
LIVGCGSIGERHLRCFQQTRRAADAACDADPALARIIAERYGVPTFPDFSAALQEPFDAVVICTPAHLHVPMALQVLRAGKHVLIEKPLSQSLAGIDELLAAPALARRQGAVAYVLHVYPFLVAAREFLQRAEFGSVQQVTLTSGQHFPSLRPAHAVHYAKTYYRDRRTGGGAIQDALTHAVNWVEAVIGPADSVLCDCAHQVLPSEKLEETVHVTERHCSVLAN